MHRFTFVTLIPALLLLLAAFTGGIWAWAAVAYLTVFILVMDHLLPQELKSSEASAEFPASDPLLCALAIAHFGILALCIFLVAPSPALTVLDKALITFGAGLFFGQVSHPAAHELIHRKKRALHRLGQLIYTSLWVGHHASAHLRVHHAHVGQRAAPRRGEGFYRYAMRASLQSFRAGWQAETRLRGHQIKASHPYLIYVGGAFGLAFCAWLFAGLPGLFILGALSLHAQVQILMSDYVQHYGLERQALPHGAPEPVGPQHSWNAPHWFSSHLMLHAPRHSDHHVNPNRPYPALRLSEDMPMLPYPLPVMAALALLPRRWRRLMDPRCATWRARPWTLQPDLSAGDIPPAVLAAAKSGGIPSHPLPNSGHATDFSDPVPEPASARSGPKLHDRGRV